MAMDGSDVALFPFLPYIFQDVWEIGASPEIVVDLIKKHSSNYSALRLLDLGCGKGAVSIKIAKELGCNCIGIDALEAFISQANNKAMRQAVNDLCEFKTGDIRQEIKNLRNFNIVLLGAIGPVFGDYYSTLTAVKPCLAQNGIIIIDDGYIEDDSSFRHPLIEKKSIILKQISKAKMQLIDELIVSKEAIKESEANLFPSIEKRCRELINKYPSKKQLFINYINKQKKENYLLENEITCATMVLAAFIKDAEKLK